MPIDTNFSFHQIVRSTARTALPEDLLGLLRGFVGNNLRRSWKGPGFNMIWRPNFGNASGPLRHFLQLNMTEETLEFTDITGAGIANRGLLQNDIQLGGVAYIQSINDSFDNTGQHFEPGVWNHVPRTDNPNEPTTVVRMGSIPHGTTINMQGTAFTAPQPIFNPSSITPFRIGSPDDGVTGLVPFPDEEDLSRTSLSRTDLARVASLTQAQLSNPNLFLSQAIAGQTILSTTVLIITSDSAPPAVPDAGGGTDNIAFLVGTAGGPNANVPRVTAVFWIERVKDAYGYEFDQLQYTQRVLLDFGGLSWPHVTVATLRAV